MRFERGYSMKLYRNVNKDAVRDAFLHGDTHADTRLYMIHYVKYQSDGRSYHSKDRYFFGKRAATEHCEKVFQWLHNLYCADIISDYNIGMHQIY